MMLIEKQSGYSLKGWKIERGMKKALSFSKASGKGENGKDRRTIKGKWRGKCENF